ncbi:hypothetical protein LRP88_04852 [Fusarium phalaenopsidis]|nr:hypothetical protein NCS56_00441500 [Fusarium sp. Ph1]
MQQSATSKHSFILKWVESIDSDQDTRDANGFTTPTLPSPGTSSWANRSNFTGSCSDRILEEGAFYRRNNLQGNGIYLDYRRDATPEHITNLVNQMRQDRDSPGPEADAVLQDRKLHNLVHGGASKPQVARYFLTRIFFDPRSLHCLKRDDREPMARRHLPSRTESNFEVSTPVPDAIYGYKQENAFPQQWDQLWSLGEEMMANNQLLVYPFLVVEFMGGERGESMLAGMNRCMGGSASCVNMVEKLNRRVKQCTNDTVHPINSAAFSIAIRCTEARVCVSWKQNEQDYHMADVDSFLLQVPEHSVKFYKYVQNILDWGKGERLEGIRKCLEYLPKES